MTPDLSGADLSGADWQPIGGTPGVTPDFSKAKWQPVAPQKPDLTKAAWKPSPAAGEHPTADTAQWTMPKPGKPPKWLFGVGPNDVGADYRTTWQQFGKGGIRPQFKSFVDELGNAGFSMGVYDFDRGHHYAANDPHLDGRAMDVDSVNGESVGTKLTPKLGSFIETALAENSNSRVGVPKEIYAQLPAGMRDRAFIDAPAHIHVELTAQGMTDPHATPDPFAHMTVGQMTRASVAGIQLPFNERVARAWASRGAESEAHTRTIISALQRVPIQGMLNALGGPQRGVGELVGGIEAGHDPVALIHDFWHGFTDAETARHATDSVRAGLSHVGFLAPGGAGATRQQVREWANEADIPAQLKPYLATAMNTIADFSAQTLSDPLTYAGGLGVWAKGVTLGVKGMGEAARMLAAVDELALAAKRGENVGPWTQLCRQIPSSMWQISGAMRSVAGKVGGKLAGTFEIRPDLSDFSKGSKASHTGGFTFEGKQRRMATENSELSARNAAGAADKAALTHPTKPYQALAARYLRLVYQHGVQKESDAAAGMLGAKPTQATGWLAGVSGLSDVQNIARDITRIGTEGGLYKDPQEVLDALSKGRQQVRKYATAQRTAAFVKEHPDSLRPGSTPQTEEDWRQIAMHPKRQERSEGDLFAKFRELQRANVMMFPYAHGIVNVGQLSYLGAPEREGMSVVMNAFRFMAGKASGGKLPGSLVPDEEMLAQHGAAATYVHEHEAPGLWAKWPAYLGGSTVKNHIIRMQSQLQGMETGWRASLWKALEEHPEYRKLDPLLRGAMVSQKAGDPRNVAAFVRSFEQLGGPFVSYRLGIVPRAVLDAVAKNPQRVLAAIRPVLDLQQNRSRQAQADNTLMINDPVENAARLFGPGALNYLLSPSTVGLFGFAQQLAEGEMMGRPWEESALNTINSINPFETLVKIGSFAWPHEADSPFNPMPGQKMSLADHLTGALLVPFASFYFAKAASQKYAAQTEKRVGKAAEEFDRYFIDMLMGKGQ